MLRILFVLVIALLLLDGPMSASGREGPETRAAAATQLATHTPANRNPRHEEFVKIAEAGGVDVLFLGDSIPDFWRRQGKAVRARDFAPLKAANFGIGGDGTKGVLWRVQNGELEGFHLRVVVLLIGTNDLGDKPEAIAARIKDILVETQKRSPGTRIILHALFPRGEKPHGLRDKIEQVNKIIVPYAQPEDPNRVVFVDIGDKFLNQDKTMNKELMSDTLHPSEKGYELWAGEIVETVKALMKETATPSTTLAAMKGGK